MKTNAPAKEDIIGKEKKYTENLKKKIFSRYPCGSGLE
jgi:hypothetical protein